MPTLILTFAWPDSGRPPLRLYIADDSIEDIDALVSSILDVTSEEERKEFFLVATEIVDGSDAVLDWMKAFIERPLRVKSGTPVNPTIEDIIERLEAADTAFQNKCSGDPDALRALLYAHGATYHDEDLGKIQSVTETTKRKIIYEHLSEFRMIRRVDDIIHLFDDDAVLREALGGEHLIEYNESYYRVDE